MPPLSQESLLPVMDGNLSMTRGILCRSGTQAVNGRRIIVGLKSDNCSREMLLRVCSMVVVRGDSILAVHVEQSDDTFDPNTFHIHEDLCKSKQVEFEIKICTGCCYITELSHQVRVTLATILVVGCSRKWPKDSMIAKCQKAMPPTCQLLVIDNGGKIIFQKMGTSQQGSASRNYRTCLSSISQSSCCDQSGTRPVIRKFLSMPSSSTASTPQQSESEKFITAKTNQQLHYFSPKFSQRLAMLEVKGQNRWFTVEELNNAMESFGSNVLIGEGAHSRVYQAILENGQAVAVKVLNTSRFSEEFFFQEVDILSGLKHKNIVQLLGHCYSKEMLAIVYNLHSSSLKLRLNQLKWSGRIQIAFGVAKALEYLHSCCPPIIHKAVNSSNILMSEDGEPHLSGFGAAKVQLVTHRSSAHKETTHVIETLGYLAPEYAMYGKVDEKIDVYSYGVVLLELITGKEAVQASPASHQESLVLWARSLLTCGLCERLIDPSLNGDYNKEEMKAMMNAGRLCLLHSSSRRPTMKTILHILEEANPMLKMQNKERDAWPNLMQRGESILQIPP
ncbi:proline-rich receptor-like protein kinase PERK8 [Sesamum indicum]|uniref:Proline-rich receptor-like protein kinase PERK8 n=1 Tax=Sesamum indicum TaxID=4182 RepID=A0A6I9TQT5_SESIN|nr:proline-rich receptor-like protein kinase PERK8 [Sesamum indicum]